MFWERIFFGSLLDWVPAPNGMGQTIAMRDSNPGSLVERVGKGILPTRPGNTKN